MGRAWIKEARFYLASGALCGYLIAALLFFDNALSLASGAFLRLGFYLVLCYGLAGLAGGGMAALLGALAGRIPALRRHWPEGAPGRGRLFAGLLVFALLFFWNFDSFYRYTTFAFWDLMKRLLTESFLPVTVQGAVNLLHLGLLMAVAAAAVGGGGLVIRRLGEGRWRLVLRVIAGALLLLPWIGEGYYSLLTAVPSQQVLARPGRKLLFIGVDALDWKIGGELMAAGELPNLQSLMARGAWGPLETLAPAYSPMVWTTIATGKPVADHNIRHFIAYSLGGPAAVQPLVEPSLLLGNPYVLRLLGQAGVLQPGAVTSNSRHATAFWEITSQAHLSTAVLGWWASAPAEPVSGLMVSDYATHGDLSEEALTSQVYPPGAIPLVAAQLQAGREPPEAWQAQLFEATAAERRQLETRGDPPVVREVLSSLRHDCGLAELAKALLRADQPDLLAVYLEGIDTVGHMALHYWLSTDPSTLDPEELRRYRGTARAYYHLIDQMVGELCRAAAPDTYVLLVSDHGFSLEEAPNYFHHHLGPPGVFCLAGPAVRPNTQVQARVFDVLPTLLYTLGIPVAGDLEGRVVAEAFDDEYKNRYQVETVPSYAALRPARPRTAAWEGQTAQASEAMVERLRTLGYIK